VHISGESSSDANVGASRASAARRPSGLMRRHDAILRGHVAAPRWRKRPAQGRGGRGATMSELKRIRSGAKRDRGCPRIDVAEAGRPRWDDVDGVRVLHEAVSAARNERPRFETVVGPLQSEWATRRSLLGSAVVAASLSGREWPELVERGVIGRKRRRRRPPRWSAGRGGGTTRCCAGGKATVKTRRASRRARPAIDVGDCSAGWSPMRVLRSITGASVAGCAIRDPTGTVARRSTRVRGRRTRRGPIQRLRRWEVANAKVGRVS